MVGEYVLEQGRRIRRPRCGYCDTQAGGAKITRQGRRADAYGTPTTFTAGQVLDVVPGGTWETLIGAANVPVLAGAVLTGYQTGSDSAATANA